MRDNRYTQIDIPQYELIENLDIKVGQQFPIRVEGKKGKFTITDIIVGRVTSWYSEYYGQIKYHQSISLLGSYYPPISTPEMGFMQFAEIRRSLRDELVKRIPAHGEFTVTTRRHRYKFEYFLDYDSSEEYPFDDIGNQGDSRLIIILGYDILRVYEEEEE